MPTNQLYRRALARCGVSLLLTIANAVVGSEGSPLRVRRLEPRCDGSTAAHASCLDASKCLGS